MGTNWAISLGITELQPFLPLKDWNTFPKVSLVNEYLLLQILLIYNGELQKIKEKNLVISLLLFTYTS